MPHESHYHAYTGRWRPILPSFANIRRSVWLHHDGIGMLSIPVHPYIERHRSEMSKRFGSHIAGMMWSFGSLLTTFTVAVMGKER